MARINSVLLGNYSKGRIGNVVLKTAKDAGGRFVQASAYQPQVANPQSDAQMYNRVLLGTASRLASGLKNSRGMQNLYTNAAGNKSQFNWFVQNFMLLKGIELVTAPEGLGIANTGKLASGADIVQAGCKFTQGDLSFTQMTTASITTYDGGIGQVDMELEWNPVAVGDDRADDVLIAWIIDVFTGDTFTYNSSNTRSEGAASLNITTTVLLASTSWKAIGFSFFRQDETGKYWSQVSYPRLAVHDDTDVTIPLIDTGAYETGTGSRVPGATWGLG